MSGTSVRAAAGSGRSYDIPLPFDLRIEGHGDYTPTRDTVLRHVNVSDRSVLDVGSTTGYLSLEMARAGARAVRGVETDGRRLGAAVALKKIWGVRNVDFLPLDILADGLDLSGLGGGGRAAWRREGRYDVVLLANVVG